MRGRDVRLLRDYDCFAPETGHKPLYLISAGYDPSRTWPAIEVAEKMRWAGSS
jgi:hypothetical protein